MSSLTTHIKLSARQLKRLPINLMLRDLVTWEPQTATATGYSVAIACMSELSHLAIANLRLCERLNLERMHEMILVFDCPVEEIPSEVVDAVRDVSSRFAVRLIGYDERQHRIARRISWGWVYGWMSWCLAIRHARTRAVIIHDLDAMPLEAEFFERRYDQWDRDRPEFCGIGKYLGEGITETMDLVKTYELVLDAEFLRESFRPYDLFNKLELIEGRIVSFDTMLYAQWRSPRRTVRPIDESDLVHPSQLICQWTDLFSGRSDLRGLNHMLPVLVYFLYLGGDTETMPAVGDELAVSGARSLSLFGREASIDGIKTGTWAWMEKQIRRVEQACFGTTRPEVEEFLRGFIARAGSLRSVGRETGPKAIKER